MIRCINAHIALKDCPKIEVHPLWKMGMGDADIGSERNILGLHEWRW